MLRTIFLILLAVLAVQPYASAQSVIETDICVYGGTSAGVIAGYSAKKLGKNAVVIEPTNHLGGMTASGLGSTDIGNKYAITGLSREFYRKMGAHYGIFEQWNLEPSVAERQFNAYVEEAKFQVLLQYRIVKAVKEGTRIVSIEIERVNNPSKAINIVIKAKQFMDCSYEGDLLAAAGVSYHVGREANSVYGENYNGIQLMDGHQMPDSIDPYREPGNPRSGLVWGINPEPLQPNGTGDKRVQAYNFRLCLSTDPNNQLPFEMPEDYDASRYELVLRMLEKMRWKSVSNLLLINKMPNNKTDVNHKGGFSIDFIGGNWDYPEADYEKRARIWKDHENYIKGFLYFLATDKRLPEETRTSMLKYGWPKDEFLDNGGFPHQLYVREARRMIGELVMTEDHCQRRKVETDEVGMAAYTMDSHNCQRVIVNGMVKNEGNVEVGTPGPYPISYRAIVPKKDECTNLTVPVCMSASHIAYGSIRMEPVFMVLAQSSTIAAAMAIDGKIAIQDINVKALQQKLKTDPLLDGSTPEALADDMNESAVKAGMDWKRVTNGGYHYGLSYLMADTLSKKHSDVVFTPSVSKVSDYDVYIFAGGPGRAPLTNKLATNARITVVPSKGKKVKRTINLKENRKEWIHLGTHTMAPGKKAGKVILSTKGADGLVIADAVLFVPKK